MTTPSKMSIKDLKKLLESLDEELIVELTDPSSLSVELSNGEYLTLLSF